jgi:hypothetical protein
VISACCSRARFPGLSERQGPGRSDDRIERRALEREPAPEGAPLPWRSSRLRRARRDASYSPDAIARGRLAACSLSFEGSGQGHPSDGPSR